MCWPRPIQAALKQLPIARRLNARLKSYWIKRTYRRLCAQAPERKRAPFLPVRSAKCWPWRVLFVGTDWEQDRGGIIQGLRSVVAETHVFEREPGKPGQLWSMNRSLDDRVREHNAAALRQAVERVRTRGPLHAIVGQMWNLSMPNATLADFRRQGIRIVNISMDDRHAFLAWKLTDGNWCGTAGLIGALDLACTAAPECVAWYERRNVPAIYLPEASDPELFRPMKVSKRYDVCFVGACYGLRQRMVEALERNGVRVQAYGDGWPNGRLPTVAVPDLFARSKIVLGCGTILYCEDFYALKMRDFDGPMSGSLYMTHNNPDLHELFVPEKEIVLFDDLPEMVQKVRYYLNHPEERECIALAGRQRAMRHHTWKQRFQTVFSRLEMLQRGPKN